ncbi:hypothetical protein BDC45DRAFT_513486 [Circinella umbellata]|nr:hypothetical protein BDC45DRAFT_513486 [Circinella umbellata]
MVKNMPPPRPSFIFEDEDDFMDSAEPERVNLNNTRKHDWEKEWRERLESYKTFMEPFLDPHTRHAYWQAKQEWRRGLFTTEMLLMKKPNKTSALEESKAAVTVAPPVRQAFLSKYFAGAKKPKVDTPEEYISNVRIPNDLYSGVHQILPLAMKPVIKEERSHYYELDDMMNSTGVLEEILGEAQPELSSLEGILVDPPWEFYIKDGRNDGRCTWDIKQVMDLLKKVVDHMTAGLVFVWTHKLLQADVVRMMDALDCKYVENLVWFKKSINNDTLDEPSPYISSSKEILLMFKKGDGFELRHQRSPDVIIDFELPPQQWISEEFTEPKPQQVFDMIETLLPRAGYNDELKRGRLLELWAKRSSPRREGWIAFHQRKSI